MIQISNKGNIEAYDTFHKMLRRDRKLCDRKIYVYDNTAKIIFIETQYTEYDNPAIPLNYPLYDINDVTHFISFVFSPAFRKTFNSSSNKKMKHDAYVKTKEFLISVDIEDSAK